MTRRRFYAPPSAFTRDAVHLDTDEARYLREVLRLKVGEQVFVFNGEGREFRCTIEEARRDS
ncbi:MAG: 16S rRNA (uracil(1498)-N(3))-methyltransferase, partial [Acidobacteria bacterium]|nr:16S rRNA (uracil(1498)-N(3))-methyltransferase [Acidobacteriota bacterium]